MIAIKRSRPIGIPSKMRMVRLFAIVRVEAGIKRREHERLTLALLPRKFFSAHEIQGGIDDGIGPFISVIGREIRQMEIVLGIETSKRLWPPIRTRRTQIAAH